MEPEVYPTRDEAIAAAMIDAEDGDEVLVHAETCATREPGVQCDGCAAVLLVVRRGAA